MKKMYLSYARISFTVRISGNTLPKFRFITSKIISICRASRISEPSVKAFEKLYIKHFWCHYRL